MRPIEHEDGKGDPPVLGKNHCHHGLVPKSKRPISAPAWVLLCLSGCLILTASQIPFGLQAVSMLLACTLWFLLIRRSRTEASSEVNLQQSHEQFQRLFLTSPLPSAIFREEDGSLWDVNERFLEVFGWRRSELLGSLIAEQGLWRDPVQREKLIAMVRTETVVHNFEVRFHPSSGPDFDALVSAQSIQLPWGPAVMLHALDLTERKQSAAALREKDQLLHQVIDLVPHFIFAKDKDSRFLFANRAAADALGMTPEELVGLSDRELPRNQEEADSFMRDDQEVMRSGKTKVIEEELLTDSSGNRRVHQTIKVPFQMPGTGEHAILGVAVDITQAKKAQASLEASEQRFRTFVEASPSAVFKISSLGKIEFANRRTESLFGYTHEELMSLTVEKLIPEGFNRLAPAPESQYLDLPIVQAAGDGQKLFGRRKDGSEVPIEICLTPIHLPEGISTLATITNISERKRLEVERGKLETQVLQAQKLEAIGTLAGGIAHDFNNILGAILGNAQIASMDISNRQSVDECLDAITKAALRAKRLVQQILTFSSQKPQKRQITEARPIILEAARLLKSTIPAGVEVITEVDPHSPTILADPTQVHQILINLGTNAWHAMDDKPGRIWIRQRTVCFEASSQEKPAELLPGTYSCISVSDTGKGMNVETIHRIFEPFFTTKEPGKGTGLGLSVVHGIVRQHEGTIQVTSLIGEGSTFEVFLPAAAGPSTSQEIADLPQSIAPSNLRILIIDDEESLVSATKRLLSRLGHRPTGITRPAVALQLFRQDPTAFDLVITDQNMPIQSGTDVAAELLSLQPHLPILMVSGQVTEELKQQARRLGVREILQKPLILKDLLSAIEGILGKAAHLPSQSAGATRPDSSILQATDEDDLLVTARPNS